MFILHGLELLLQQAFYSILSLGSNIHCCNVVQPCLIKYWIPWSKKVIHKTTLWHNSKRREILTKSRMKETQNGRCGDFISSQRRSLTLMTHKNLLNGEVFNGIAPPSGQTSWMLTPTQCTKFRITPTKAPLTSDLWICCKTMKGKSSYWIIW